MSAKILDGKILAGEIRSTVAEKVREISAKGIVPGLAVVLIGDDPASASYVSAKERACQDNGIFSRDIRLPVQTGETELLDLIDELNNDPVIHGILIQLPLPNHIDEDRVISRILPSKDVDGFHPVNLGNMMLGRPGFLPCTPNGVIQMLKSVNVSTRGKHCVIVGRSNIVGKPLANMLLQKGEFGDATVTVCHSRTPDLKNHTLQADILIAAVGMSGLITEDMVKPGATVIDVGVNRIPDAGRKSGYRLVGDVDFDGVSRRAAFITPVPGGVGPMTITMLLWNTLVSALRHHGEAEL